MAIRDTTLSEDDLAGFRAALDAVCRERRYLCYTEAPEAAKVRAFVEEVLTNPQGVHVVAEEAGKIVGWCDIYPSPLPGFQHSGRLGCGIIPGFRDRGIGRELVGEAVARGFARGLQRIELDVFASNERATALYESLGFKHEGRQVRARHLDGIWEDKLMMAILRDEAG